MPPPETPGPAPSVLASPRAWNAVALVLAAGMVWHLFQARLPVDQDDFSIYYRAAAELRATGDPYASTPEPEALRAMSLEEALATRAFLYPPLAAVILEPFSFLSQQAAQDAWFLVNLLCLAAFCRWSLRALGWPEVERWKGVVFLGLLLTPPVQLTFRLGQMGLVLAALLIGAWLVAPRSSLAAGALLAFGGHLKLFPFLLPVAFRNRYPRVVPWTLAIGGGLFAASLAWFGPGPWGAFFRKVLGSVHYPVTGEFNVSLHGFLKRLFAANPHTMSLWIVPGLAQVSIGVSSACVLWVCSRGGGKGEPDEAAPLGYSLWLTGMLLLSPINGTYNHGLLLFPVLAAWRSLVRGASPDRTGLRVLILAIALACWPPGWAGGLPELDRALRIGWGNLFLTPAFYGLVLIFLLLGRLVARSRGGGPVASSTGGFGDT
ncbi:MAG: DUF2029 domain-containing protein [Candidatus Riflebacteria bacterium]|nr:DUF2029 domain-containing protein [Candidatus Riflebacteria bacterium]